MSNSNRGSSSYRAMTGPAVVGSHWPLRDEPLRSVLRLGFAAADGGAAAYASGEWFVGGIAAAAIAAAMWRMFVPVDYELGIEGVALRAWGRVRRFPWRAVGTCRFTRYGVFLYGTEDPAPVDAIGAVFVPWCGQRDAIEAQVRRFVLGEEPAISVTVHENEAAAAEESEPSATESGQAKKQAT